MSKEAMLPCIVCGTRLTNAFEGSINQPEEGTEFQTQGHYGSTFWDSFDGEEIIVNICDECLGKNKERIARRKRYRRMVTYDPRYPKHMTTVGRQWVDRETVPYFDGPEDQDPISIEPEEIGALPSSYGRIEWVTNWREIKADLYIGLAEDEDRDPTCKHVRFVAECLDCGARPLEGLK